jgi:eukaryotic-like serine/threonine-protein kinase
LAADVFGIVGTVVASAYHVEGVVAEGGFGVVYRARHGGFRAPVALKCLKVPQHLGSEYQRRFLEQFRAEGEVMFRLSASIPNVVRPLHVDVLNTPGGAFVPFMVLEWLDGDTLDAILRARVAAGKRPLPPAEVFELLEPVGRALERAHHFSGPAGNESIAHCDIKPENVFVAKSGGERLVKILDFGVAKVRGAATDAARSSRGNAPEIALFTPAYGAPEQWNPKRYGEAGPWTDVWGLGLTLVETLVGRPVINGDHAGMMRQALDPLRRPTPGTHGVVLGDALEAVFLRALAIDPRERYRDAGALWRALKAAAVNVPEGAVAPAPAIPDLVPVPRRPSGAQRLEPGVGAAGNVAKKIDLAPARAPSGAQRIDLGPRTSSGTHKLDLPAVGGVDFDDDSSGEGGSGLALDLPAGELARQGTLASVSQPPGAEPAVSARGVALSVPPAISSAPPGPAAAAVSQPPVSQPSPPSGPNASPSGRAGTSSGGPEAAVALKMPRSPPPVEIERSLALRLVPAFAVGGASVALTLFDRVYAAVQGEVFTLGPLRTTWIVGILFLAALALAVRELLSRR